MKSILLDIWHTKLSNFIIYSFYTIHLLFHVWLGQNKNFSTVRQTVHRGCFVQLFTFVFGRTVQRSEVILFCVGLPVKGKSVNSSIRMNIKYIYKYDYWDASWICDIYIYHLWLINITNHGDIHFLYPSMYIALRCYKKYSEHIMEIHSQGEMSI